MNVSCCFSGNFRIVKGLSVGLCGFLHILVCACDMFVVQRNVDLSFYLHYVKYRNIQSSEYKDG